MAKNKKKRGTLGEHRASWTKAKETKAKVLAMTEDNVTKAVKKNMDEGRTPRGTNITGHDKLVEKIASEYTPAEPVVETTAEEGTETA